MFSTKRIEFNLTKRKQIILMYLPVRRWVNSKTTLFISEWSAYRRSHYQRPYGNPPCKHIVRLRRNFHTVRQFRNRAGRVHTRWCLKWKRSSFFKVHLHLTKAMSLPCGFLGNPICCSHRVATKIKEKFHFRVWSVWMDPLIVSDSTRYNRLEEWNDSQSIINVLGAIPLERPSQ